MTRIKISIVFPVFNEELNLPHLFNEIKSLKKSLSDYDFELIFVDDSSMDSSVRLIQESGLNDIKLIRVDTNRGHQFALSVGLKESSGDFVATMDADLQHPFKTLEKMILKIVVSEYDAILTYQTKRTQGSIFKRFASDVYWKLISSKTNPSGKSNVGDFRILRKSLVSKMNKYENSKVLRFLIPELSRNIFYLEYTPDARKAGESKYSFKKMFSLGFNGYLQLTTRPLAILAKLGIAMFIGTLIYSAFVLRQYMLGQNQPGWTSIIVLVCFFGSLNLMALSLIGEYVGRLHDRQSLISRPYDIELH